MNKHGNHHFDKEAIFNFLEQKLDERLSELEALRANNNQNADYIRKKIDLFSQQLNIKDVYSPPLGSENLSNQLREFFKDLREGRLSHQQQQEQLECVKMFKYDGGDSDDVNDPSVNNTCDTSEGNITTEKQSQQDAETVQATQQNDIMPPKSNHVTKQGNAKSEGLVRAASKAKLENQNNEQPKMMIRSSSKANVRSTQQLENKFKQYTANTKADEIEDATIKPKKAANSIRHRTPGRDISHQKKLSTISIKNDTKTDISELEATESKAAWQIPVNKTISDSIKVVRPPRKVQPGVNTIEEIVHDEQKETTTDFVSSKAKTTVNKEKTQPSLSTNFKAAVSAENCQKDLSASKARSRTLNRVPKQVDPKGANINKQSQKQNNELDKPKKVAEKPNLSKKNDDQLTASEKKTPKIDFSKPKYKPSEPTEGKKLKPSVSVTSIAIDNKKSKTKSRTDENETPTFSGIQGAKRNDNKNSKGQKATIDKNPAKLIPLKAENGPGTLLDAHMLSFDMKDQEQENLLSGLHEIDQKLQFKDVTNELRADEGVLVKKSCAPIKEKSESGSPERKAISFTAATSSKKKILELNIEQIEENSVESWMNNPGTHQHKDQEDDFVNGEDLSNHTETDARSKIDEDNDFEKINEHESPEKAACEENQIDRVAINGDELEEDDDVNADEEEDDVNGDQEDCVSQKSFERNTELDDDDIVNKAKDEGDDDNGADQINNSVNAVNEPDEDCEEDNFNESAAEENRFDGENSSPQKDQDRDNVECERQIDKNPRNIELTHFDNGEKAQIVQLQDNSDQIQEDDLDYEDVNGPIMTLSNPINDFNNKNCVITFVSEQKVSPNEANASDSYLTENASALDTEDPQ